MRLCKKILGCVVVSLMVVNSTAHGATLTQIESDTFTFDANQFDSKSSKWTELADSTTSPSLASTVMVYDDTGGIDASTTNNSGSSNTDLLTYSLNFTSTGDYYVYIHAQGEFFTANNNDSIFIPDDAVNGDADTTTNSLFPSQDGKTSYFWIRLVDDDVVGAPAAGTGVVTPTGGSTSFDTYTISTTGTTSFSIAGREQDFQLDRIVFAKSGTLTASQLDALSPVPEPASLALMGLGGLLMLTRRRDAA